MTDLEQGRRVRGPRTVETSEAYAVPAAVGRGHAAAFWAVTARERVYRHRWSDTATEADALRLLPSYVADRTTATRVSEVDIP